MVWNKQNFVRPKTFQLVSIPKSLQPKPQPIKRRTPVSSSRKPVPKKTTNKPSKPEPKPERVEEDLSELEDLLSAIPEPAAARALQADFKYFWYTANVQAKIERNWNPPLGKKEQFVLVEFVIFRDGSIGNVKLNESSGITTLDNLALGAVQRAAPFGRLPPKYTNEKLGFQVTLRPVRK